MPVHQRIHCGRRIRLRYRLVQPTTAFVAERYGDIGEAIVSAVARLNEEFIFANVSLEADLYILNATFRFDVTKFSPVAWNQALLNCDLV